jgi:hypothetical protein
MKTYGNFGVEEEYWVVDPAINQIEIFRENKAIGLKLFKTTQEEPDVPHVENISTCVMRFFRQDYRIVLDLYHFYPVILSNILYI